MKLLVKIVGILLALFAALLVADRSFRFSQDYTRNYIDIPRKRH